MLKMKAAALVLIISGNVMASSAYDGCFKTSGARHNVPPELLKAIAITESNLNPRPRDNVNKNGSKDYGMMQINTLWLATLRQFGITKNDLYDACTSIEIGAWVLAQKVEKYGLTWRAVGAYNAGSEHKRRAYVNRVWNNYLAMIN